MKQILISFCIVFSVAIIIGAAIEPKEMKLPSVWIQSYFPNGRQSGVFYNDLKKLNDHQYLFVGKDGLGKTFDSTIITVNK